MLCRLEVSKKAHPYFLRALVRQLEQTYFEDEHNRAIRLVEEIYGLLCHDSSSMNATNMDSLSRVVLSTKDVSLLPLSQMLIATTNLWSALIAHRTSPIDSVATDVHALIAKALKIIQDAHISLPDLSGGKELVATMSDVPKRVLSDSLNRVKTKKSSRPTTRKAKTQKGIQTAAYA